MNLFLTLAIAAAVAVISVVLTWSIFASRYRGELERKAGELATSEALRLNDKAQYETSVAALKAEHEKTVTALKAEHEKTVANLRAEHEKNLREMKEWQKEALEMARKDLVAEGEKNLRAREESLKAQAKESMEAITGKLKTEISQMTDAFEKQKKSHAEESSSIKTKFEETVRQLKEQTLSIGNSADDLAKALKGRNKMQGNFGETILENILKEEGLRAGHDYESEFWLRDKNGNLIVNEETGRRMRPDFVLHFPDDTDILIDSKVSLTALSEYFSAEDEEGRKAAAAKNLESVRSHIRELCSKEYQKYVSGRKTLDYVIMFIPNYGAYQLAKQEAPDIFAEAFRQNVLITAEEPLIPFLRLIRTAWVQKEQMENISEIVKAAQDMVERVGIFCRYNAELEADMSKTLDKFRENPRRLVDGNQSIVKAARRAIDHGVNEPSGKNVLPSA